ncbi:protoheme IX farnesyltransferase [Allofrancisella guangzhouensis]|uniref:Protoheme IX farnesyltransferase n=1 Tax=Allofrancisella guangzhouensis TaxID=594679 RepID=A0A0A8E2S6_9GAMM|nr:heme o synthase [Allofrancisella guangzhouensis]AJC48303.1 protoheme IX farnesyltransferase [Allofrancisella guangzhouensis]MBK2026611.1 protoheme IX farnesyltransferase [Allofrancisella guangzhouensis]MBK2044355.1 protoheme IX farnesyltransferase [Allofrancisella guangzhouensis]MBK2045598.1 protoheme IX farnesyltransferase [Allofrancisella guangzhouensis]
MSFKKYFQLTKPGIIFGNLITFTGGFLLATNRQIGFNYLDLYLYAIIGTALMIGSGCVFNNCFDHDIDAKMQRTQNRALVTNDISLLSAMVFGAVLFLLSSLVLYVLVNPLTLLIIIIGFMVYVGVYTVSKRFTVHATLLGGISGAIPPVAGYTAVVNNLDLNAFALFLILFFWQIPHSYAIAILYIKDYKKIEVPLLPIVRGLDYTKKIMLVYMFLFIVSCSLPYLLGTADIYSLIICELIATFWLYRSIKSFYVDNDRDFAKIVFKWSIIVITVICLSIG